MISLKKIFKKKEDPKIKEEPKKKEDPFKPLKQMDEFLIFFQNKYELLTAQYKVNARASTLAASGNPPVTETDFNFFYDAIKDFNALLNKLETSLTDFLKKKTRFTSKLEIHEFSKKMLDYAAFYEIYINYFYGNINTISRIIQESENIVATSTPKTKNQSLKMGSINQEVIIKNLHNQLQHLHSSSTVTVIAYDMIRLVINEYKKATKKLVFSENANFLKLDYWIIQQDQQMEMDTSEQSPVQRYAQGKVIISSFTENHVDLPLVNDRLSDVITRPPSRELAKPPSPRPPKDTRQPEFLALKNKFNVALSTLKLKTNELIDKADLTSSQYDSQYLRVGVVAQILIQELESAERDFFNRVNDPFSFPSESEIESFKLRCHQAIDTAEEEFMNHRNLWDQLYPSVKQILGVLALITIIPAVLVEVFTKHKYEGTFFGVRKTDASVKLETFKEEVDGLIFSIHNPN